MVSSSNIVFFRLSLRSSIHHCGQCLNGWEVVAGEKHNQTTAKAGTAATSSDCDKVVCFSEE